MVPGNLVAKEKLGREVLGKSLLIIYNWGLVSIVGTDSTGCIVWVRSMLPPVLPSLFAPAQ